MGHQRREPFHLHHDWPNRLRRPESPQADRQGARAEGGGWERPRGLHAVARRAPRSPHGNRFEARTAPRPPPRRRTQATPKLLLAAATGQTIATVTLTSRTDIGTVGRDYFKIVLGNARVTGATEVPFTGATATSSGSPVEEVTFTYASIKTTYSPLLPNGTPDTPVCTCWNVVQAATCTC